LAKYFLEQFYWHDANYQNTVYAYDRYIEKYPNGKKKDIALRNRAIVKNDLSEYEKLLKTNPDDEQIRWRRDLLLMIHAQNENTKEAFQRFINKYPDSAFASTAQWYINNVYK
jgi:outer membrane protein assembly factor BamD (BamD/ComL family)